MGSWWGETQFHGVVIGRVRVDETVKQLPAAAPAPASGCRRWSWRPQAPEHRIRNRLDSGTITMWAALVFLLCWPLVRSWRQTVISETMERDVSSGQHECRQASVHVVQQKLRRQQVAWPLPSFIAAM